MGTDHGSGRWHTFQSDWTQWPPCLRIIAATALLVRDADKLMYGQQLWVYTPYAIKGVLKQLPGKWISNARFTHYQVLLLDAPRVRFRPLAS